jgi:hypothetical protein
MIFSKTLCLFGSIVSFGINDTVTISCNGYNHVVPTDDLVVL